MESKPLPLKLAAILYADVAEYSRLTGEDEQGTHRRLSEFLDLISEDIGRHNGRVVHYAGDAVLADFGTVVDALICAASVQRELSRRNEEIPDERKVRFRIGVNMGDVIEDRGDIYGDGVNVAARLESLAEPGGICISESVHTAVGHKLPFDFEYMGEQEVKNIIKPIKAYRARLQPDAELPAPSKTSKSGKRTTPYITVLFVLVVGIGVLTWLKPWEPREVTASVDRMAFPLPDKPSIAVLPFTNMSADAEQGYFADGITEDLITDLSKLSGLFVIARNSTFVYKGKPVNVRQVAEDLGVRYVLEGSVRRANSQLRINAQLIDALTGGHVWAERYDGSIDDVFAVQDKVSRNVVAALEVQLTDVEKEARSRGQETVTSEAYEAFLRGRVHYNLFSPDDFRQAIPYLEKAIQLEPEFAPAHAVLGAVYWHIWDQEWAEDFRISYDDALKKAANYIREALKNPTPLAYHISSRLLNKQGRDVEALAEAKRAVALDPNDASGYIAMGRIYNRTGRPAQGLEALKLGARLDPQGDTRGALSYRIGESYFHLERFEEAAENFKRATERNPNDEWGFLYLAAAYGHLDQKQEAQLALKRFNEAREKKGRRHYTLASMDGWVFADESIRERYREGLRKAGMPQGGALPPLEFRGVQKAVDTVAGAKTIDAAEAQALLDRGVPFVDVNSDSRWKRGHIPGAVHLNLYHDFTEAGLLNVVDREDEIVIYAGGLGSGRSTRAVATAVAMGFKNVYFFREGFPGWKAAGYPIEVGSK